MNQSRHIHLIGICGTAMASLAGMLKQRNFHVTGSDAAAYPPMSDFLTSLGIEVLQPYAEANLQPRPDLVIVGNAISRGNPELEHVLDNRIPFRSLPQVLYEEFLTGHESIAVAGTHGKTTTSSMLSWIFQSAGKQPSFLVGGIAENFGRSFTLGEGPQFILEADEYDTAFFDKGPKFLHYFPDAVILTSVEFDHADIYRDLEAVKTAFRRLVNLVPRRGIVIAHDNPANVADVVSRAFCPVERYGFTAQADWQAVDLRFEPEQTTWTVLRDGDLWAKFGFALPGEFNVLNATAAAAMAAHHGIEPPAIAKALRTFKSVKRRQEVKAEVDGITVIDDFAHHPTAIAETLKALRTRYAGRRLWAVLEPRSNTLRRSIFQDELVDSLSLADAVIVAGVFHKTTDSIPERERLDTASIVKTLNKAGKLARQISEVDQIVNQLVTDVRPGDVIAILSNGGFGGIYEKLPRALRHSREVIAKG
jgi:UDP-N-acetylmuramate: L-alanyl-gamma-D-glutamyl-meso-diaminopimelate ligase